MTTKLKVLLSVLAILTSYAIGRWEAPVKVVTKTQIVEVEKKTADTKTNENTTTVIVEKDTPDGTKTTTTTITQNQTAETKTQDQTNIAETQSKEVDRSQSKVTISALAATNVLSSGAPIVYGAAITKPVLGPITIGLFGFTDSRIGASLGLTL